MAAALTTITNVSQQVVPILVDDIATNKANSSSNLSAQTASQLQIPPGSQVKIETQRLDVGQLERLQVLKLITFTS